jgi:hypothetical protein
MKPRLTVLALVLAMGFFTATAEAQLEANIFVVHAINGTDIGLEESLTVGVKGGPAGEELACLIGALNFKDEPVGPVPFDAGKYDIEVRVGDCDGPLAVSTTVDLAVLENASIVAHLTEEGIPVLTKFVNDVRMTGHESRISIRHTAAAPSVNVLLKKYYRRNREWIRDLSNGEQGTVEVRNGNYKATVFASDFPYKKVAGPIPVDLNDPNLFVIVYAVGSLKNGTFDVLPQVIDLSHP